MKFFGRLLLLVLSLAFASPAFAVSTTTTLGAGPGVATVIGAAETAAFFARLATQPTAPRAALYSAAISASVSGGCWAKLDWLHVSAAFDEATALTNLVSSSYDGLKAGAIGTPTFTQDRGWNGSGTSLINTQFNPSTAGGLWTQNSAAFGGWSLTSTVNTSPLSQNATADGKVSLYPRYTADKIYFSMNTGGTDENVNNADGSGLYVISRTASNLTTAYRNGVSLGTSTIASAALTNSLIQYSVSARVQALSFGGAGMTVGDALCLYNSWLPYMQGVGAV